MPSGMKNFFSVIIIFAVLVAGGIFIWASRSAEQARIKVAEDLSDARRTFAQKARAAANQDDDDAYHRSMSAALESYKEELSKKVYRDHPDLRDIDAYKKTLDEKFEKNQIDEAKRKSMMEGYTIVKEAFDTILGGSWNSVLTAKGSADTRLDLYTIGTITDADNQPMLEGKFFFWGIEDNTNVNWGQLNMRMWVTEMGKVKEGGKMVDKEIEKVLGKAEGEAQPHIIIQAPAKYIDQFPAFVSIGYLRLPLLPREAKWVDIDYTYSTRVAGSGGETQSTLSWKKMPIPDSWKLKEGQEWDADVVEATEDEIAGRDGMTEEEAAAAAAAAANNSKEKPQ